MIFGINFRKGVIFALALGLAAVALSCTSKNSNNNVAATVDGQKIYSADVEKYFQNQIAGSPLVNITGFSMFGSVEIEN